MSKPKLTPWFPADVKPVHVGEYEYRYESGYVFRAYFDGAKFVIHDLTEADWWGSPVDGSFSDHWRGLANPPKKTKQKGEK